jgi:hypothetical protein
MLYILLYILGSIIPSFKCNTSTVNASKKSLYVNLFIQHTFLDFPRKCLYHMVHAEYILKS